jgi:hypothetical protein
MDGMLLNSPGGSDGLVDYDKLKATLRDVQNAPSENVAVVIQQLPQSTGDEFLDSKIEVVKYLAGPTGKVKSDGDGNMSDVINEIQMYIDNKSQESKSQNGVAMADNAFNWVRYCQQKKETETSPSAKKKKKTKANPFRVLMGMVGKLLDHGVPKPTVVRHVTKNTSFDEPTVDRAVDIVREYNRKQQRRDDVEPEIDMEQGEKPEKRDVDATFNYVKYVKAQKASSAGESRELYNAEPQWEKRSTAELFSRLGWLNSLMGYDSGMPMGDGKKAADKQGANGQIDKITSELQRRGFNQEEIDSLLQVRGATKG